MSEYDMKHNIKVVPSLAPLSRTADAAGSSIDTLGFRSATILTYIGAGGITFDATNKLDVKLEHSDDNSVWSAVAADDVLLPYGEAWASGGVIRSLQAAKASADTEVHSVGYVGKKRYVRPTADFSGTHGSGTMIGIDVLLGHPESKPVGQSSFEVDLT